MKKTLVPKIAVKLQYTIISIGIQQWITNFSATFNAMEMVLYIFHHRISKAVQKYQEFLF